MIDFIGFYDTIEVEDGSMYTRSANGISFKIKFDQLNEDQCKEFTLADSEDDPL